MNLSRSAFNYLYFIDGYRKVYEKYHSPAECIEFEFLESIVLTTADLFVLKIDRSLFQKKSPREQALIEQIIHTAHHLGMQTVAEGVETWSYVDFLRKTKCDYI